MSLATVDDVAARLGRHIAEDERTRVQAFLEDVSAMVADYCGTDFSFHSDALVQLDTTACGAELVLPRFMLPVAEVAEVRWASGSEVDDWTFDGLALWRRSGWQPPLRRLSRLVTVRASFGYQVIPQSVTAVVCAEVVRWLAVQPGVQMERVGELEVSYGATAPSQSLSGAAREALRRYRRAVASREVRKPVHVL